MQSSEEKTTVSSESGKCNKVLSNPISNEYVDIDSVFTIVKRNPSLVVQYRSK